MNPYMLGGIKDSTGYFKQESYCESQYQKAQRRAKSVENNKSRLNEICRKERLDDKGRSNQGT